MEPPRFFLERAFAEKLSTAHEVLLQLFTARGITITHQTHIFDDKRQTFTITGKRDNRGFVATFADFDKTFSLVNIDHNFESKVPTLMSITKRVHHYINQYDLGDEDIHFIILTSHAYEGKFHASNTLEVAMSEIVEELGHTISCELWHLNELQYNPLLHEDTPFHTIVPKQNVPAIFRSLYVTTGSQLPALFTTDKIVRCLGAKVGDIIRTDEIDSRRGVIKYYLHVRLNTST